MTSTPLRREATRLRGIGLPLALGLGTAVIVTALSAPVHAGDPDGGTISTHQVIGTMIYHGGRAGAYAFILDRGAALGVVVGPFVSVVALVVRRHARPDRPEPEARHGLVAPS